MDDSLRNLRKVEVQIEKNIEKISHMPEKVGDCIEHTVQEIGDALNSGFIGPQPVLAGGRYYGP